MRSWRLGFAAAIAAAFLLSAEAPWQDKDFRHWTDKDAEALMTDSPWAKQIPYPASARPAMTVIEPGANGAAPPTASLGNPSSTTTGTNMTVAANPGSAGPADPSATHNTPNPPTPSGVPPSAGAPSVHPPVSIIWASATPVRLAVLRIRHGEATLTEGEIENAEKPREHYVVAVSGLPAPQEADVVPSDLAKNASLRIKGHPAETARDSNYRRIGNSDVYFFRFLRSQLPLSVSDGEVEFRMRMGQLEIKKRFNLKTMQFSGELAL